MNFVINALGKFLLTFYIFKDEKLKEDYIKDYKLVTCIAMQKGFNDNIFVQEVLKFFQKVNSWWDLSNNHHMY